ncbi:MAG: sulfotransferase [Deltaproteobacteria bacterium]
MGDSIEEQACSWNRGSRYQVMYFHCPVFFRLLRLTFSRRYFSPRHAALALLFIVPYLLLRGLVWTGRGLDRLFFPEYRGQAVVAPIYIIGNPRSGTTFSHRLLSRDLRFSYFELFHTVFPAITFYKLFAAAGAIDSRLGRPGARLLNVLSNWGFRGWEKIHRTGPREAESDEMLFVYAMLSPLLALLFPFLDELPEVKFVDRLPAAERQKLMGYYRDCLQRHLYAVGPDKVLLQKVALIAGRLQSIYETFPDMRIVYLVRHPYESIPSLISMFRVPWRTLVPAAYDDAQAMAGVAEMIFEYYRSILRFKRKMPANQFIEIRYQDLVADPQGCVEGLYSKLGLAMSEEFRQALAAEAAKARNYKSRHRYSLEEYGLSKDQVYRELREVFEEYGFEP